MNSLLEDEGLRSRNHVISHRPIVRSEAAVLDSHDPSWTEFATDKVPEKLAVKQSPGAAPQGDCGETGERSSLEGVD